MNKRGEQFKICTKCSINHVENCTTCLGFGLYKSEQMVSLAIISAGEAYDKAHNNDFIVCSECGGNPFGCKKCLLCEKPYVDTEKYPYKEFKICKKCSVVLKRFFLLKKQNEEEME